MDFKGGRGMPARLGRRTCLIVKSDKKIKRRQRIGLPPQENERLDLGFAEFA